MLFCWATLRKDQKKRLWRRNKTSTLTFKLLALKSILSFSKETTENVAKCKWLFKGIVQKQKYSHGQNVLVFIHNLDPWLQNQKGYSLVGPYGFVILYFVEKTVKKVQVNTEIVMYRYDVLNSDIDLHALISIKIEFFLCHKKLWFLLLFHCCKSSKAFKRYIA